MGKKRQTSALVKFLKKPSAEFLAEGLLEFLDPGSESVSLVSIVTILSKTLTYNRLDYFLYLLPIVPYHEYFFLLDTDKRDDVIKIYEEVDRMVEKRVILLSPIDGCSASDGNCMYASVLAAAQKFGVGEDMTVEGVRAQVAERIIGHLGVYRNLLESQLLDLASEDIDLGTNAEFLALITAIRDIASDVRQAYIQNNNLVDRYIALIRENGVWGGDVELGVMGQILDVQIDVHNIETQIVTAINNDEQHSNTIAISFAGNHYNTIEGYNIVLNDI